MFIQRTNQDFHVSVSAGIALLKEENTYEDLFKKADDALYEVKRKVSNKKNTLGPSH